MASPQIFQNDTRPEFTDEHAVDRTAFSRDTGGTVLKAIRALNDFEVPTFFVAADLFQSLINTDLPADFSMEEMPWPFPAMLFALPHGMLLCPCGHINLMAVIKTEPGRTYAFEQPLWSNPFLQKSIITNWPVHERRETMIIVALASSGKIFTWESPLDSTAISEASNATVHGFGLDYGQNDGEAMNPEEELFASKSIPKSALQLILGMLACPEFIETGVQVREAKEHKKKKQCELWSPNFIGRAYRKPEAVIGDAGDNEHGHRRIHWRRGHFRHQRSGNGKTVIKVIWIQRQLIGAKRLETATA